ncbi:MAG: nucleotide sugar dehydrogenase [Thermoplasmata archaeon]|nr:nucleotide sugar dehydrogenase [Thermoplasmata archaeon]
MSSSPPLLVGIDGLGYMGLASGLAFAQRGIGTVGFDIDEARRKSITSGNTPVFEPGLQELLTRNLDAGRFEVATTLGDLARVADVIFLCLPTPTTRSGRIDLRPLVAGVRQLRAALRDIRKPRTVVVKSTVVPGTTEGVVRPLLNSNRAAPQGSIGAASNPEFLAEGSMVQDALNPQRIVLGVSEVRTHRLLHAIYKPFHRPTFSLTPTGAEMVKYASNAFLALKISFANEMAQFAGGMGVNIDEVMDVVGRDNRIGRRFLAAGPGFGGSCFDKDLRAMVAAGSKSGVRFETLRAALSANRLQAAHCLQLIESLVGRPSKSRVAILGLSFKDGTDDVRESRAFPIARALVRRGVEVRVHDPQALETFRREWERTTGPLPSNLVFCRTAASAIKGADLAVLQSAWPDYLTWPTSWSRSMRDPQFLDLRRALPPMSRSRGQLRYYALGDGTTWPSGGVTRAASFGSDRSGTAAGGS